MAFTINPDGSIKVDTAAEMREALTALREQAKREGPAQVSAPSPPSVPALPPKPRPVPALDSGHDSGYRRLVADLKDEKQRKLLQVLVGAGPQKQFSDTELRAELQLKSNVDLRGVMIGIIRRALNRNLPNPIQKVIFRAPGGRNRIYHYSVTPAFKAAMGSGAYENEKLAM